MAPDSLLRDAARGDVQVAMVGGSLGHGPIAAKPRAEDSRIPALSELDEGCRQTDEDAQSQGRRPRCRRPRRPP